VSTARSVQEGVGVLAGAPEELVVDIPTGGRRRPFVAGSRRVVATAEKGEGGGCGSASFGIQVA